MKAIILKGLPGSGKSTWAKDFCEKNPNYIRVNRDDLRNMRGKYWLPKQEDLITQMEKYCIQAASIEKLNVIVDATNLNEKYFPNLTGLLTELGYDDIETKFFDTPVEECVKRDAKRANSVGAEVIYDMYYKNLAKVDLVKDAENLPVAVIFDIDGTLALHNGRSPYDYSKLSEDLPNKQVVRALLMYATAGARIMFLSGRPAEYETQTKEWIDKNVFQGIEFDYEIGMRDTGDNRNDAIVKRELFDEHIRGRYNVMAVFEDRKRVKRMWTRELGLFVFDVNQLDKEF